MSKGSKGFFCKLAANNIKKNGKIYFPYVITCILTVAMFYMVKSLSLNPGLTKMRGAATLILILYLGSKIVAIFSFFFLFYTNSFLIKRRKKEFGVFNILGMEKKHLARVIGWETIYVILISLTAGLILGIAFDKVMYLLITKMTGNEITLGFFLSKEAIFSTIGLFCIIFCIIFLYEILQIHLANPIKLLQGSNVGEKEPKAKWLLAIIGVICLVRGYSIAIFTENPIAAISLFFQAVLLVIIGTYLLFTAGSITLLKILRKNKKYYYQTKHFTSVSGMIYRMKQNAVGLANICILSTMVLVMVSSTTSLMVGLDDILNTRHPYDFILYITEISKEITEDILTKTKQLQQEEGLDISEEMQYTYLDFAAIKEENTFLLEKELKLEDIGAIHNLVFVPLSDYNKAVGAEEILYPGEVLLASNRDSFPFSSLKIFDKEYKIVKQSVEFLDNGMLSADITGSYMIVVPDMQDIQEIYKNQQEIYKDRMSEIQYFYGFNTEISDEEQLIFYEKLGKQLADCNFLGTIEIKAGQKQEYQGIYGGLFFLGVFLGLLFIMATVLIIYYKQISEGYDDKERFEIMQKVGMSKEEVKASIHSQVLSVFFLPLIVAGIHVAFAFPIIEKMLAILNLLNTSLYIKCTIVSFLFFAVMYILIYLLTARTYYRIVSK